MAHLSVKAPLRTHRTHKYGSLTVLAFTLSCTHVEKPRMAK